jgi:uncharacterized phiE125 gp8 family phage protein
MSLELITAPTVMPITVSEVKEHVRLDPGGDVEDGYIEALIEAVVDYAEVPLDEPQFITATWDWRLDRFPAWQLCVPRPPLQSVTSITYLDSNGDSQTLDSSLYVVDTKSKPGRITPAYGEVWPATYLQMDAVTIRIVCGYGAAATSVPKRIRWALLLIAAHLFEERQPVVPGQAMKVPLHLENLLTAGRIGVYV